MRRLANAPWLAALTIGFLTAACTIAGQDVPNASGSPVLVAAAPVLASPMPTAGPTVASTPRPEFSAAHVPKEPQKGVPPENAPVVFKEVRLSDGQAVSYELTADASASYQCWNPMTAAFGTQNWTITRRITVAATLTADAGGSIRSILQLRLPRPDTSSCSPGFRAVAYAGKYDHVLLVDTTNNLRVDLEPYQFIAN